MESVSYSEKRIRRSLAAPILEWGEELLLALVIVILLFTVLFRVVSVTGDSMTPNYQENDKVLVWCWDHGYAQGDVVVIANVFPEPIIKRVIATEGQTVDFDYRRKAVLVDGKAVDETLFGLPAGITEKPFTSFALLDFPQTVPEGCVFVLGDNRAVSEDSRYEAVGMVDTRSILGKAVFRLFPLNL